MTQVIPIRDLRAYLESEQVERLIAVAPHLRDKLLVRIPWRTGIRVTELIVLKESDIDYDSRAITVKVQKQRKKDDKTVERRRVVPVDRATLSMLKGYLGGKKQFPYNGDL